MLKDFFVHFRQKTATLIGKLSTLAILISLAGCSSSPYYGEYTTADRTNTGTSIYGAIYNWGNASAYTIPRADRQRHQRCIFFALEETDPGQTCTWVSPETSASGVVKLISRYPQGNKICHVLFTNLRYGGKVKDFSDVACYSPVNDKWTFISRS